MSLFDRISKLWKGKVSSSLSELEGRNAGAVYEAAISERERRYKELKQAAAGLTRLRDQTGEALERARRELSEVLPAIEAAAGEGDEDTALVLIQQKDTLEARIPALQEELEALEARSAESLEGLRAFRAEIERLRRERDELLAQEATAEARIQLQESLSGSSAAADVRALSGVRASIERLHAEAGEGPLDSEGMRRRVGEAGERVAGASARAQLEAMKAQLAAMAAGEPMERTLEAPAGGPEEDGPEEPTSPEDGPLKRSL